MKKIFLIQLTIAVAHFASGQSSAKMQSKDPNLKTTIYAGVYSFGKNAEKGPVGTIKIYPETDSTVLFYISLCKGAPSYNLGQLYSRLNIKNGMGTFYAKTDLDERGCKWLVTIKDRILTIMTLVGCDECGFGGNVYADNQYRLIDRATPKSFTDIHSQEIYFSQTSPENYLK